MHRLIVILGGGFLLLLLALFGFLIHVLLASGDADYWETEIAAFERRDVSNPPPQDAVLFLGGRSLRRWATLERDMAPYVAINRGFGGAQVAHITHYASRIATPYRPAAVVIMAGADDLADVHGRRPEDVLKDFVELLQTLRKDGIEAPVFFVSIPPQPMRTSRWYGMARANELVAKYTESDPSVHFIDVTKDLLLPNGKVNVDYFRWDGLTLSGAGYQVLSRHIKPALAGADIDPQRQMNAPVADGETSPPAPADAQPGGAEIGGAANENEEQGVPASASAGDAAQ
ncbi:lysophospholipase L1-like esterase [Parvibaculum indicum]|uniref:GDSL-type esterase/lipase family protein n=1 Tax=Parvibaculum indicum TaxID=562969 RepID=UPI001421A4B7|nr:GDSL-type esterase/lipase family protein [Parvibaculum indicum]NIJ41249.1 lysophospholipase L1-like esterase [Parvibaculum indicum]